MNVVVCGEYYCCYDKKQNKFFAIEQKYVDDALSKQGKKLFGGWFSSAESKIRPFLSDDIISKHGVSYDLSKVNNYRIYINDKKIDKKRYNPNEEHTDFTNLAQWKIVIQEPKTAQPLFSASYIKGLAHSKLPLLQSDFVDVCFVGRNGKTHRTNVTSKTLCTTIKNSVRKIYNDKQNNKKKDSQTEKNKNENKIVEKKENLQVKKYSSRSGVTKKKKRNAQKIFSNSTMEDKIARVYERYKPSNSKLYVIQEQDEEYNLKDSIVSKDFEKDTSSSNTDMATDTSSNIGEQKATQSFDTKLVVEDQSLNSSISSNLNEKVTINKDKESKQVEFPILPKSSNMKKETNNITLNNYDYYNLPPSTKMKNKDSNISNDAVNTRKKFTLRRTTVKRSNQLQSLDTANNVKNNINIG